MSKRLLPEEIRRLRAAVESCEAAGHPLTREQALLNIVPEDHDAHAELFTYWVTRLLDELEECRGPKDPYT
jgi:hypothetical protein